MRLNYDSAYESGSREEGTELTLIFFWVAMQGGQTA